MSGNNDFFEKAANNLREDLDTWYCLPFLELISDKESYSRLEKSLGATKRVVDENSLKLSSYFQVIRPNFFLEYFNASENQDYYLEIFFNHILVF